MKDYCNEIIKKDRYAVVCILSSGTLICLVFSVIGTKSLIESGFQVTLFAVTVVTTLTLLALVVLWLKKPFQSKNLNFVKNILKQCPGKEANYSIDSIMDEINADLNQNGKTVGSFLVGDKWLLGKPKKVSIPQAIDLMRLIGFASGWIKTDNGKTYPAVILVSDTLGDISFYCSENEKQQFYTYLKERFPNLNTSDTENIALGPWILKNFVFSRERS